MTFKVSSLIQSAQVTKVKTARWNHFYLLPSPQLWQFMPLQHPVSQFSHFFSVKQNSVINCSPHVFTKNEFRIFTKFFFNSSNSLFFFDLLSIVKKIGIVKKYSKRIVFSFFVKRCGDQLNTHEKKKFHVTPSFH